MVLVWAMVLATCMEATDVACYGYGLGLGYGIGHMYGGYGLGMLRIWSWSGLWYWPHVWRLRTWHVTDMVLGWAMVLATCMEATDLACYGYGLGLGYGIGHMYGGYGL